MDSQQTSFRAGSPSSSVGKSDAEPRSTNSPDRMECRRGLGSAAVKRES